MALLAYLIISAVRRSVMMIGASRLRYSPATASAAPRSSPPRTTRSGARKSLTAVPSARNSGLETTAKVASGGAVRRRMAPTQSPVPMGTVLLFTMMVCPSRCAPIVWAAVRT